MTSNADVIRKMTDEELVKFLVAFRETDIDVSRTFCDLCKCELYTCDECVEWWTKNDAYDYNGLLSEKGINSGYAERKEE